MKNWTLILFVAFLTTTVNAQKTSGEIHYKQTIPLDIEISEEMEAFAAALPKEIKNFKILTFNKNESIYTEGEKEEVEDKKPASLGDGEVVIEFDGFGFGGQDETYFNRKEKVIISQRSWMGKTFLVNGKIEKVKWKMVNEQKEILGYTCQKATMIEDSTTTEAWFTMSIPVAIGPDNYYGLPGAILSIENIRNDKSILSIKATKVDLKTVESIKKPTKGKAVTEEEYEKIMKEFMEDMEKMNGGNRRGNRTEIIIMD